jgi:hypothetical protein
MQEQQALQSNEEKTASATLKCRSCWRYNVMLKQQALNSNAELAGATR